MLPDAYKSSRSRYFSLPLLLFLLLLLLLLLKMMKAVAVLLQLHQ